MTETVRQLIGDFVILDLGSADSRNLFRAHPELAGAVTLIEVDARPGAAGLRGGFHRRTVLHRAVAGQPGRRMFKQRRFPEGSSFLDPWPHLLDEYALHPYFELVKQVELDCATITELLRAHEVPRVDFFKTDLEGLDFEVLSSAPDLVRQALCIQCELRFQPFFQGEPPFHEVVAFLAQRGLDLVWMRPEVWKYATPHRDRVRGGRTVWADVLFFLDEAGVRRLGGVETWKLFAKQMLLAKLLGLDNFAEHLFVRYEAEVPEPVRGELRRFLEPSSPLVYALVERLGRLPGAWRVLGATRRICRCGYRLAALFKDRVIGTVDVR